MIHLVACLFIASNQIWFILRMKECRNVVYVVQKCKLQATSLFSRVYNI